MASRALNPLLVHLLFLSGPLICFGTMLEGPQGGTQIPQRQLKAFGTEPRSTITQWDDSPPVSTIPIFNPTPTSMPILNPTTGYPGLPPFTPVITAPPVSTSATPSGKTWCVASQFASQTALQVALDYACGFGGADCSAIQQGGSCFNPDTVRDHASYAFNSYYQKNPTSTSCDFGGTATITTTDPSTPNCQYPASIPTSNNQFPPTMGNNPMTTTTPNVFGPPTFSDSPGLSGSSRLSKLTAAHFMLLLMAALANL